jgi:AcrR family transcriptional regulator
MTSTEKKRVAPSERKASILRAGMAVLERKDYHDITMEEVAREAGVAKGTPYLYFPTKEKLFSALAADMRRRAIDNWKVIHETSAPGAEKLKALVRQQLDFFENYRGLFLQVLRGNLPTMVPGKDAGCAEMILGNIDAMSRAVKEAADRGQFRKMDARTAAVALFGIIRGFVFASLVGGLTGPLTKRFDEIWDVFQRGVRPA